MRTKCLFLSFLQSCYCAADLQRVSVSRLLFVIFFQQMHDEVSETENIRKNLAIERMIIGGCDILLDVNQVFVRQGEQLKNVFFF